MRLLETALSSLRGLAIIVTALLTVRPVLASLPPVDTKEIVVYIDVSRSSTAVPKSFSHSYLYFVATKLREVFNAPTRLLREGDTLRIFVFADRVQLYTRFPSWKPTDQPDLTRVFNTISDEQAADWKSRGLNTDRTNLGDVIDDIGRSLSRDRQQIFIIASDFAHDPKNSTRDDDVMTREADFSARLQDLIESLNFYGSAELPRISLLVSDALTAGPDTHVGRNVVTQLLSTVRAQSVDLRPSGGSADVAAIFRSVFRPIALKSTGEGPPIADLDRHVSLVVHNRNAFDVPISKIRFTRDDNSTHELTIDPIVSTAEADTPLSITIPSTLASDGRARLSAITDYGDSNALDISLRPPLEVNAVRLDTLGPLLGSDDVTLLRLDVRANLGPQDLTIRIGDYHETFSIPQPLLGSRRLIMFLTLPKSVNDAAAGNVDLVVAPEHARPVAGPSLKGTASEHELKVPTPLSHHVLYELLPEGATLAAFIALLLAVINSVKSRHYSVLSGTVRYFDAIHPIIALFYMFGLAVTFVASLFINARVLTVLTHWWLPVQIPIATVSALVARHFLITFWWPRKEPKSLPPLAPATALRHYGSANVIVIVTVGIVILILFGMHWFTIGFNALVLEVKR